MTSHNGGEHNNVFSGTTFDDQSDVFFTAATFTNNVTVPNIVPEGALGAFVGENPNGTWQLEIDDDNAANDGTLVEWGITIHSFNDAQFSQLQGNNTETITLPPVSQVESEILIPENGQAISAVSMHLSVPSQASNTIIATLTSPAGTIVPITFLNGGIDNYLDTHFADDNLIPITDFPFVNNTPIDSVQPEGAFSAFMGESPGGVWTLQVGNTDTEGNSTQLTGWDLTIETLGPPPQADLAISKLAMPLAGEPYTLGGQVQYALSFQNLGPDAATEVLITDPIPPELNYVSDDCGGMVFDAIWWLPFGDMAIDTVHTCNLIFDIQATGTITNTASIQGELLDPDLSNNSDDSVFVVPTQAPRTVPASSLPILTFLVILMYIASIYVQYKSRDQTIK